MPTWLVPTLKWGGIGLAIIAAVAILYVRFIAAAPAPEAGAPSGGAPVALYWILFGILRRGSHRRVCSGGAKEAHLSAEPLTPAAHQLSIGARRDRAVPAHFGR
jgi:hypothetical protein